MAVRIKFDTSHNPELPTFVLATRSGKKLGLIENITNVHIGDNLNAPMDISFSVHKILNDSLSSSLQLPSQQIGYEIDNSVGLTQSEIWDEIKNFRKVWISEWDKWFTLTYGIDESDETIKNVSLVPNSEFELSNVNIHNLEINTESDILRENYTIPTVFYNPEHPEASLLHRVLSYTKGFVIKHVDDTLKNIQRTFTLDGNTIYDTLQQIGEDIQCLFVYDSGTYADDGSIERAISAYDLRTVCHQCGHRGNFFSTCPKCGSNDIEPAYGYDTSIFVDKDALAESLNLTTDTDSVKNCFRLLSGDDLMDAAIIATNPNGTQYLWYFSDEMTEDMSPELKAKLQNYDEDYQYYQDEYTIPLGTTELTNYNNVVRRYTANREDLIEIDEIVGYAELMNALYDVMDFRIYLESGLLPTLNFDTNAQEQADKIKSINMPYVAVQNLSQSTAITTINSAVEAAMKILIDQRYTAKIVSSNYNASLYRWTGNFKVTANSDSEDTATSDTINIAITDTYETFAKQKIEKAISQSDKNSYSMVELFSIQESEFVRRLKMYSRAGLRSILESCNAAIGIMVEMGISNPTTAILVEGGINAYYDMYLPYILRLRDIEAEVSVRDSEIATVQQFYDMLIEQKHNINDLLDINTYLGDSLAIELNSYKMEDDFQNSNYISEGLNNAQLFKRAIEFVEIANNEIRKAATEHHTISTTMRNLLSISEFEPLVESFAVGNWIRVKIDNNVYRVKLLSYTIDFDNLENLQVTFSDVIGSGDASLADIFASAQSMAKSYDSVKYQAVSGAKGRQTLNTWVNKGLDLTTVRVTNAENQTLQLDQNGMSMLQYDDITQGYTNYGSRWINTTLAFTKDNWETTETALGRFDYWNPKTEQYEEGYGIIAKQLIGNIILGDEVGIYNQENSVTIDGDGIIITANGDDGQNSSEFSIVREYTTYDEQGNPTKNYDRQLYIDEDGKLIYKGEIYFESDKTIEEQMSLYETISQINNEIRDAKTLNVTLSNESHVVPTDRDGNNGNYTDCNTKIYVFYGSSDITSTAIITPTASNGITGNWNSGTYTYYVSDMTTDSGKVEFDVVFDNLHVVKTMQISKAKAGGGERGVSITGVENYYLASANETGVTRPVTDGTGGWITDASMAVLTNEIPYLWNYEKIVYSSGNPTYTNPVVISRYSTKGNDAVRYDIVISHAAIMKNENDGYSPSSITIAAQKQVGDSGLMEYNGRFVVDVSTDNTTWTNKYTSSEDESRVLFTIPRSPSGIIAIKCILYKSGGTTILLDQQIIPVATSGVNGLNQATIYLYQRSATQPNAPTDTLTYNFTNGRLTGDLGSWSRTISTGDNPCWVTIASAMSRENTDTIEASEWSTPIEFIINGEDGTSGYNQATIYLYQRSATKPNNISSSSTYTFSTGVLSNVPSGWSISIPTKSNKYPCWVTTASAISKESSVTIASNKWAAIVKLAEDGEDGLDGYTVALTNENHTFSGNSTSANPATIDCQVIAYKGTTSVPVTITSISGQINGQITAIINQFDNSVFTVNVTNQLKTSGVLTINFEVGSERKQFSRDFSYSIAFAAVRINSVTVTYGKSNSASTLPSSWQNNPPSVTQDQYLWTRTVTDYIDNEIQDTVEYTYTHQGKDGVKGDAGTSVTVQSIQYQEGTSATQHPTGTWVDGDNIPTVKGGNYLWSKTTFSDGSVAYGIAKQGVGIARIDEYYKASSSTEPPSKSSFTTTVQNTDATNRYLWNYEKITYTDDTVYESELRIIGTHGENGTPSRRYDLVLSQFAIIKDATNNVYNPTSISFSAQYQDGNSSPSSFNGYYKIETTTNNTTWTNRSFSGNSYTIPTNITGLSAIRVSLYLDSNKTTLLDQQTVPIILDGRNGTDGTDGKDGDDAYTVILTNESHTFSGNTTEAISGQVATCNVIAYKGVNRIDTRIGTIQSVDGLTVSIVGSNPGQSQTINMTTGNGLSTAGMLDIPITVDGKTFVKTFSWSVALTGNPAIRYDLITSNAVILKTTGGVFNPSSITFSAQSQTGGSLSQSYSGNFKIEKQVNGTWTVDKTYTNKTSVSYTIPSTEGLSTIRCSLYSDTNMNNLVDQQTIPIVSNGQSGYNQANVILYKRYTKGTTPSSSSKPTGSIRYSFYTETVTEVTSGALNGWSKTIPTGNNPCWVIIASASNSEDSDVITSNEWSTPILLEGSNGENGEDGLNGYNQATIFLYKRSATIPTSKPSSVTYTFSNGSFTVPSGWSKTVPVKNNYPCWVTTGAAISNTATATISEWSDIVQLAEDGDDAYTAILTNESHTFSGTSTAAKKNEIAICNVIAYKGSTQVSARVDSSSLSLPDGITVTSSVTGMSTKLTFKISKDDKITTSGTIDIPIAVDGTITITKQFSYSVALAGVSAMRHYLDTDCSVIVKSTANTYNPTRFTVYGYSQEGNGAPSSYSGRFIIERTTNGTTWTKMYDTHDTQSKITTGETSCTVSNIPSDISALKCSLYYVNSSILLDQQTIPILSDGAVGEGGYTVLLSNENHTFSGDTDSAIPASITMKVLAYQGITQLNTSINLNDIVKEPSNLTNQISATVSNNNSKNTTITISVTDGLTTGGVLHIPIQADGKTFTKDFTWSIAFAGQPTASYTIDVDNVVVKKSYDNILTPDTLMFKAYYREGTNANRIQYEGYFKIYEDNVLKYPVGSDKPKESQKEYIISSYNTKIIRCELYSSSTYASDTMLDVQSVTIVSDVDGIKIGSRNLIRFSDTLMYNDYGFYGSFVTDNNNRLAINDNSGLKQLAVKQGEYIDN